jgi:periplasmic glucans biosynthesis protein
MHRRELLKSGAGFALGSLALPAALWGAEPRSALQFLGTPQPFDYTALRNQARALSKQPYQAPAANLPGPIAHLNWDQMQAIRFKQDHALWRDEASPFRLRFFHLGLYNKVPVKMFQVVNGRAQELAYDPNLFDYGDSGVDGRALPKDLGFAGFQVAHQAEWSRDIAAFQGASYFRAIGGQWQYGMSARGLAVNCGMHTPEEFPIFTAFWFERPPANASRLTVYALLDSPSVTGAYRFEIAPGDTLTMDVDAALYPRKPIERFGVAPLTSMFLCGENDRRMAVDFRPEIHDSDGLWCWTGAGEWIWRPLVNPTVVRFNSFFDNNPRGFGLLQRDHNFDHYQDDGVFYDRRPSVWVEPRPGPTGGGWGKGAVQLVEIPTVDETFDNIVAFWNPAEKPQPGQELRYAYRLHWGWHMPVAPPLATVNATRTGIGGVVGQARKHYSRRFAVDFAGGRFSSLKKDAKVEPVITASRGQIEIPSARPLAAINGWRAIFDLKPTDESVEPIDIRLFLRSDGQPLTETWLYQWTPPPPAERTF